jgi:uncharacterized DUF497 family protein
MTTPTFEWDAEKAAQNLTKHRVSFGEAVTVFRDPLARIHPALRTLRGKGERS